MGIRNRLDRTRTYPFLITKSIIPLDRYKTRIHSSKLWPETRVIDPDATAIHLDSIRQLNDVQKVDLLNLIAFRCKYKLSDMATRNFLVDDKHVYSIDEESINPDFDLRSELKRQRFAEVEELFKKYHTKMHPELRRVLGEQMGP